MEKKLLLILALIALVPGLAQAERMEFAAGQAPRLRLDVGPARVRVELGEDSSIFVDAELPSPDIYTLKSSQDESGVTITLEPKGTLGWLLQPVSLFAEPYIRVSVPSGCEVILDTWGGHMEVRGVEGEIRARSGSELVRVIRSFFRLADIVGDDAG